VGCKNKKLDAKHCGRASQLPAKKSKPVGISTPNKSGAHRHLQCHEAQARPKNEHVFFSFAANRPSRHVVIPNRSLTSKMCYPAARNDRRSARFFRFLVARFARSSNWEFWSDSQFPRGSRRASTFGSCSAHDGLKMQIAFHPASCKPKAVRLERGSAFTLSERGGAPLAFSNFSSLASLGRSLLQP